MLVQSRDAGKICQLELKGVPISFQYLAKLNRAGTKLGKLKGVPISFQYLAKLNRAGTKLGNRSVFKKNENTDLTENN